jgi:hypothetical protein
MSVARLISRSTGCSETIIIGKGQVSIAQEADFTLGKITKMKQTSSIVHKSADVLGAPRIAHAAGLNWRLPRGRRPNVGRKNAWHDCCYV